MGFCSFSTGLFQGVQGGGHELQIVLAGCLPLLFCLGTVTRVARTCEDPEGLRRGDGHVWCGLLQKLGTLIWPACAFSSPSELDVTEQTRGSGFCV